MAAPTVKQPERSIAYGWGLTQGPLRRSYGSKSGGTGGASRVSDGDAALAMKGSSGNSGSVSALPATAKNLAEGIPSSSRIWRTPTRSSAP
jgi:hypothetical protein